MALRTKTLWYTTQLAADVTDATLTALPQITIFTENSTRTFRSCLVWIALHDIITATGGTIGEHRCACSVNGAGATTITELDDIAHSGERLSGVIGPFDFTAHFTTNYPAADSTTLDLSVYFDQTTGTTLNMRNVAALIAITYEFDDGATTQYQTAIIPLESTVSSLATVETEIGTNQIPQLTGAGGLLENVAGVTVRQQFFVLEGNCEGAGGTGDFVVNIRIDTGTTHTFGTTNGTLGSDTFLRYIHIESPLASAVHAYKAWTGTTARMSHCAHTMYVTYQFTVSGTTEFLNSLQMDYLPATPVLGGPAAGDRVRFQTVFDIEEPTTITLKQSAIRLWFADGAAIAGVNVAVGSQASRAYTHNHGTGPACSTLQQRIDSGGAQGAGITLARGRNTLTVDLYRTDTADLGVIHGIQLLLNYKSGVSAQGIGAHAHTTIWLVAGWDALLDADRIVTPTAPVIPETSFALLNIGLEAIVYYSAAAYCAPFLAAEYLAGEGPADGWAGGTFPTEFDGDTGFVYAFADLTPYFQRWASDIDATRMVLETASRRYALWDGLTINHGSGAVLSVTYRAINFTLSGTISGSSGGAIDIDAYRKIGDTDLRYVGDTTRTGNGVYSVTVYDNVDSHFSEARESGTLIGRSDDGTPAGSP